MIAPMDTRASEIDLQDGGEARIPGEETPIDGFPELAAPAEARGSKASADETIALDAPIASGDAAAPKEPVAADDTVVLEVPIASDEDVAADLARISDNVKFVVQDKEKLGYAVIETPSEMIDIGVDSQIDNIRENLNGVALSENSEEGME